MSNINFNVDTIKLKDIKFSDCDPNTIQALEKCKKLTIKNCSFGEYDIENYIEMETLILKCSLKKGSI